MSAMIEERGRVVKVDPTSVWVETLRKSSCGRCQANNACGHGLMNRLMPSRSHAYIQASSHYPLQVGDEVTIALPGQALLSASVLVYLVPLLFMLLGGIAGTMVEQTEVVVIMLSLAGLVFGFLGVSWWIKRIQKGLYEPVVLHWHLPLSAPEDA